MAKSSLTQGIDAVGATELLNLIENRTYEEIAVGDSAILVRTLRPEDIQMFAIMSGDINPTHVDPEYARSSDFREIGRAACRERV